MSDTAEPVLTLVPSDEERQMREAVGGICARYGRDYIREKVQTGEPPSELWDELAGHGYLGVNIPVAYGGAGLGMLELSAVAEEVAAAGCSLLLIVVSPAIVGTILAKHGTEEQKQRWLCGIGAGTTKIASRSPSRTPAPIPITSRPRWCATAPATC
ncbi:MAG TPA: acyl-CoA dehydrogenase family protein [Solirubrobacteraceae bacterium]